MKVFRSLMDQVDEMSYAYRDKRTKAAVSKVKASKGLNVSLIKRVVERLRNLRHEKHYDQSAWVVKNECGTACCIAGHILIESGLTPLEIELIHRNNYGPEVGEVARRAIGITSNTAERLFASHGFMDQSAPSEWPAKYRDKWSQTKRKSLVAADLLDAIAKGHGLDR